MFDFIMVGAGITGLELSAILASDGYRVLVVEKSDKIGGRAQLWKKDGFTVDYGMHLIRFGPKSAVSTICKHLGQSLEYVSLGKSFVKDEDGKVKIFPTDSETFRSSEMFTFFERLKAWRLMQKIREGSFESLKEMSVSRWMDENKISGGLRRFFTVVSATTMVCPFVERSSAGEMLNNLGKALSTGYSAMYPKGGWEKLYDLYLRKIKENGELRLESKVDSIIIESGKARGVRVSNELLEAKNVVTCVPVQELFDNILESRHFPSAIVEGCKKQVPTAGIVLDYGLKERISETSGLWCMWKPASGGIFTSNLEPSLAPEGKQLLSWFYQTETGDMADSDRAKEKEVELESALFDLFPKLERNIGWRRAMRLEMVDGTELNVDQYKEKRFGPKLPGIDNLFLVGDSTAADGAGGDVGHQSVLECYKAITGREA